MVNNLEELELDRTFSALGDPTRRGILRRLARGPATVKELAAPHDMSAPAISKHLRVLEGAGLMRRQVEGRVHWCRLETQPMADAVAWIQEQRELWEGLLNSLDEFLQEGKPNEEQCHGNDDQR